MHTLLKDGQCIEDPWQLLIDSDSNIPERDQVIVSLDLWQNQQTCLSLKQQLGIYLTSEQSPDLIADSLDRFALVAIDFPQLTDGRGFSYARALREQYHFQGELRAVGHFVIDQLFYLQRCGFNAFAFADQAAAEQALDYLAPFSDNYQSLLNEGSPLLTRTKRQLNHL